MNPLRPDLTPPISLRHAVNQDAHRLARLWRRAWCSANPSVQTVAPLAHWEARVKAEFFPPRTTLLCGRDQSLLAFMVLDLSRSYLHQLFVAPDVQSQGLGRALIQEICQNHCPGGWTLHVATSNQRARRFYARCGLVEEVVDRHPDTGRERVLCRWTPSAS